MDPKCVNYTEDRIQYFFQRGAPRSNPEGQGAACVMSRSRSDESVRSLFRGLKSGEVRVQDIPRIRVMKYNGSWYTFDNKRLWVFRQNGEEIPVQVVDRPTNWQLAKLCKAEREGIGSKEAEFVEKESAKRFQGHEFFCKQKLLGRVLKWTVRDLLAARPPEEVRVDISTLAC